MFINCEQFVLKGIINYFYPHFWKWLIFYIQISIQIFNLFSFFFSYWKFIFSTICFGFFLEIPIIVYPNSSDRKKTLWNNLNISFYTFIVLPLKYFSRYNIFISIFLKPKIHSSYSHYIAIAASICLYYSFHILWVQYGMSLIIYIFFT